MSKLTKVLIFFHGKVSAQKNIFQASSWTNESDKWLMQLGINQSNKEAVVVNASNSSILASEGGIIQFQNKNPHNDLKIILNNWNVSDEIGKKVVAELQGLN